jgi:hypothetical protein
MTCLTPADTSHRFWSFIPDEPWNRQVTASPLGPTHGGLVVDRSGRLYSSTDEPRSVIVFAPDGSVVREFPPEFAGIHALTLVEEAGEEFLLGAHLPGNRVVKLTLEGRVIWSLECPSASGLYARREDFKSTAVVAAPDASIFVADGYGASVIHQFDPRRRYMKSFGGAEAGVGQLRNCHGLALDGRGEEPRLLVCDRRNRRLVDYDLRGRFIGVLADNLRRPCSVTFCGDFVAVAELEGRVSVLDREHRHVSVLGDNSDPSLWANYEVAAAQWCPGIFNSPHSVCFDHAGNVLVQERNRTGRQTKLLRQNSL